MLSSIRTIASLAVTLSVAGLAGCSLVPQLSGVPASLAPATRVAQTGSLKVAIQLEPRGVQTIEPATASYHVKLILDMGYSYQDGIYDHHVLERDVAPGEPTVFADLPFGDFGLTAEVLDDQDGVLDSQMQTVKIAPGGEATAAFDLSLGGSAAADVGVKLQVGTKDYRYDRQDDGMDGQFQYSNPDYNNIAFLYQVATGSAMIHFYMDTDPASGRMVYVRKIGGGSPSFFANDGSVWNMLPQHAAYQGREPLGALGDARHYRWDNLFRTAEGSESLLTVDRWFSPSLGMVQEKLSGADGNELSTLTRTVMQ